MLLEDLLVRYEEGMKLVKVCQDRLAHAEQKIQVITRDHAGKTSVKDFPTTEPPIASTVTDSMKENDDVRLFLKNGSRLLDGIRGPDDIKAIREQDLPQLAQEVRNKLIQVLSQTGGHLGPNLGVVELTIALHRVFNTPKDRLVFDVSHQGYVHKMFTGLLDRIHTMRQDQGLNGFFVAHRKLIPLLCAGHAGTALSAGLGMAVGRDLRGADDEHVVVVAGDAAFTCGISYEALNNAKSQTKRFIVVLNDNEWSIAKNVGAIASYFNAITTHPMYAGLHEKARRFIEAVAGKSAVHLAQKFEEGVKGLLVPSVIFEELGLHYYGPIDGHDIPLLIKTFEFLKTQEEPVILHILTKKGKGYEPALAKPDKFHGLGKYKLETGETAPTPTPTYSEIIGKTLAKFADSNEKIVAITAAMPSGTGLGFFQAAHPDRYYDVGIAEEHAALFACGLATQGLKPFLTIYSTFFQRAYDMAIHDMAIQKLNVALCMDRAGLSGDDGPTHHGLFDIGYLRHIPNWVHMQPKDEDEFVDMLWTMAKRHSPFELAFAYRAWRDRRETEASNRSCSRSEKPRWCSMDARSRFSDSATCSRSRRKQPGNCRKKEFPSRSLTRAGSNRSIPGRWNFLLAASKSFAPLKTTFYTTALAAR